MLLDAANLRADDFSHLPSLQALSCIPFIIFQLRSAAAATVRGDGAFVHRVADGAYYLRLELSLSHRSAFTAVLLHLRDALTGAVGEKDGVYAERRGGPHQL